MFTAIQTTVVSVGPWVFFCYQALPPSFILSSRPWLMYPGAFPTELSWSLSPFRSTNKVQNSKSKKPAIEHLRKFRTISESIYHARGHNPRRQPTQIQDPKRLLLPHYLSSPQLLLKHWNASTPQPSRHPQEGAPGSKRGGCTRRNNAVEEGFALAVVPGSASFAAGESGSCQVRITLIA